MALLLAVCVALCAFYLAWRRWPLYRSGWRLPGPWAVPLVGNVQMLNKLKPHLLFRSVATFRARYGRTYRLWLGPQLWIFLHSAAETRDALRDATLVKPDTFKQLHLLLGDGLLVSEGQHWRAHRRALAPAFQAPVLVDFAPAILAHAAVLVERLAAAGGRIVEVSDQLFPCVLDVIVDTSMGKRLDAQRDPHCVYSAAFHKASALLFARMMNPLLASDAIFERTQTCRELRASLAVIHGLMETVIGERSAHLKRQPSQEGRGLTLLDTLLTAEMVGEPLTLREIRDEVNTFVFAGVDTTTAAMSFILYALARYPDQQLRLLEELQTLPASPSLNDINGLEFLDMFLKECLRYYTIVPLTGRQTTADTMIGGVRYCAGVTVWINLYGLAHDSEYFVEPQVFRPERFSRAEQAKLTPFSYLPFSGGPHVCIGRKYAIMIIKILCVELVGAFEIALAHPGEELVLMAQMVLKSLHGINLTFKRRNI